ncbi:hypothetical protein ATG_15350 [Desulfurococcaceae archaeon AG1]|nr:hypothetical protein ATG_15350 [Desulfurococcaceae archaeon AG1]
MKALTFVVRFHTAQFKLHHQKLTRRTYLIPPPSAIAGFFGAILGIPREDLKRFCEEQKVMVGAELRSLGGYYVTASRIFKFDQRRSSIEGIVSLLKEFQQNPEKVYKDIDGLRPLKESEELFEPEYKFAIAAEDKIIEEGLRRLRELDFIYDVFGGNDYHFIDYIGDVKEAILIKSVEGTGYCPEKLVQDIRAWEYKYELVYNTKYYLVERRDKRLPLIVVAPVGPELENFVFVYRATIVAKSEIDAVQDKESTIFVFDPVRYLVP